jgi:hypothetical protein
MALILAGLGTRIENPLPSRPMREGLDVGNVLGRVFDMYRDQFGLLVPAALVVFVPISVINGLILNSGLVFAGLITASACR